MSADLQAMQEAIKAIGAACADLSKVVEGLPKYLEVQIGAFKAELTVKFATLEERFAATQEKTSAELETCRAGVQTFHGQLLVQRDAYVQSVDTRLSELRQIIGGNADAATAALAEVVGRVDKVAAAIEELGTEGRENIVALEARTDEKLGKLELHAVKLVDDASRVLGNDVKALAATVAANEKTAADCTQAHASTLAEQARKHGELEAAIEKVADDAKRTDDRELAHYSMHVEAIEQVGTQLSAQVAEAKTNIGQRMDSTRSLLAETVQRTADLDGKLTEQVKMLGNRIDQTDIALGEVQKNVMDLNGHTRDLQNAVDSNKLGIEELTVAHDKSSNASRDLIALAHGGIAECKADISTLLDTTNATVERVNVQTQVVVSLGNEVKERAEATEKAIGVVDAKVQQFHDTLVADIKETREAVGATQSALDANVGDVAERVSAIVIDLATAREQLGLSVKTVDERLSGYILKCDSTITHLNTEIKGTAATLGELVKNHDGFVEDTKFKLLDVGTAIRGHGEGVQSVQDAMVKERERVNGEFATYGQRLDSVFSNGKDRDNELSTRIDAVEGSVKTSATMAGTALLEVKGTVLAQGRKLDEHSAEFGNVQTRFASTDKVIDSIDKAVGGLGIAATNLNEKVHQTACEVAAVREVVGIVSDKVDGHTATLDKKADAAEVAKSIDGLSLIAGDDRSTLFQVRTELATVKTIVGEQGETLAAVHAEVEKKADNDRLTNQMKEVRSHVDLVVGKALDTMDSRFAATNVTLRGYANGLDDTMRSLNKSALEAVQELAGHVDTLRTTLNEESKRRVEGDGLATEIAQGLADNFLKVEARVVGEVATLREAMAGADAETRAQCASLFDKAEQSAAMLVQKTSAELLAAVEVLRDGALSPEALAAVETRAMARLGALADDLAALRDATPKLPDGIVTTTELAAAVETIDKKLGELAERPVQADLELPEITTAYENGSLVIAVGESKTAIPVSIGVQYRGVWKPEMDTKPGDLLTHKGSMWFCKSPAAGEPGKDFTGWQLAVKAGANGKDGHSVQVFERHTEKNVYKEGDFLRTNNRLWQCAVDKPSSVPEPGDISTTPEWVLIV